MIRWLEWVVKTFGNLESYRDSAPSLRVREMILSLLICLQCPKIASSSNLCNHDLFVALSGIYVPAGWIPQIAKTSQTRWQIGLSWVECPAIWVVAPRPTTTWTWNCTFNANGKQCSKKKTTTDIQLLRQKTFPTQECCGFEWSRQALVHIAAAADRRSRFLY